jgi:hypothetical protein
MGLSSQYGNTRGPSLGVLGAQLAEWAQVPTGAGEVPAQQPVIVRFAQLLAEGIGIDDVSLQGSFDCGQDALVGRSRRITRRIYQGSSSPAAKSSSCFSFSFSSLVSLAPARCLACSPAKAARPSTARGERVF